MSILVIRAKNILDPKKEINIGPNKVLIVNNRIEKIGDFKINNNWRVIDIGAKYTLLL